MSTVVVVKKDGYACIGADTLTKLGYSKEPAEYVATPSKITQIGNTYLAKVGHAAWDLIFPSYFAKFKRPPAFRTPAEIFETVRKMHEALKDHYYLNPTEQEDDEFESSHFDALLANPYGIFGIYALRSVQEYTKFYAFGSGYHLALGAMYAIYDSGRSAEEIARVALEAAAEFDDATAAPLEVHTVKLRKK